MKNQKAIVLIETRHGCEFMEATPRFDVMFNGKKFDQLYFNTRGYVGYLPAPRQPGNDEPIRLNFGETTIAKIRKIVAGLNREWKARTA